MSLQRLQTTWLPEVGGDGVSGGGGGGDGIIVVFGVRLGETKLALVMVVV